MKMNNNPWIVFDIDDSIARFVQHVYSNWNRLHGSEHDWQQLSSYDFHRQWGVELDVFYQFLAEHRIYETVEPEPHWLHVAEVAHDRGWNICYVTARGMAKDPHRVTLAWLEQHGWPVHQLNVCQVGSDKSALLPANTWITVEDNVGHARQYHARSVPLSLLIDRPWNVGHDYMGRRGTSEAMAELALNMICRTGD